MNVVQVIVVRKFVFCFVVHFNSLKLFGYVTCVKKWMEVVSSKW